MDQESALLIVLLSVLLAPVVRLPDDLLTGVIRAAEEELIFLAGQTERREAGT